MNTVIFKDDIAGRLNLVSFTDAYKEHQEIIKLMVIPGSQVNLKLLRLNDETVDVVGGRAFKVIEVLPNGFEAEYIDPSYEPPERRKTIRFDNPLGEIPVLPDFNGHAICVGLALQGYHRFINDVREEIARNIGRVVVFHYKNDDGSVSEVECFINEVNRSNFYGQDICERRIVNGKTVAFCGNPGMKHHRFISLNGFLFKIVVTTRTEYEYVHDDGEVFGEKEE